VLLALGDGEPVKLTADEASALASALASRADWLRLEAAPDPGGVSRFPPVSGQPDGRLPG
jgi:hypothetical protein